MNYDARRTTRLDAHPPLLLSLTARTFLPFRQFWSYWL